MRERSTLMSDIISLRDILEDDDIELKKIHTKNIPTDMLTKVISGVKFNHYKNLLCILPVA